MGVEPARRYRVSDKRERTKLENRAAIEAAAWQIFCTIGLDAASTRDIINLCRVSPGTFYNYFGSKEAVFDVVCRGLLERVRPAVRGARADATTIEELIRASYAGYLDLLRSTDGAIRFLEMNQRHVRARLVSALALAGITEDLKADIVRFVPPRIRPEELTLIASITIMLGAEAIFVAAHAPPGEADRLIAVMTQVMIGGIGAWRPHEDDESLQMS